MFAGNLISESDFIGFQASYDVAKAQVQSASDQVEMAKAAVASAQDSLDKTTIFSPLTGTITSLNSQLGERVLGTVQNMGTAIMIISDLNEMEARVDIGEMDVVLIKPGQKARLEVDAFKDRKFTGTVTQIANSAEGLNSLRPPLPRPARRRPPNSRCASVSTKSRTSAPACPSPRRSRPVIARTCLTVPIAERDHAAAQAESQNPQALRSRTNSESITGTGTNALAEAATNSLTDPDTNAPAAGKKPNEAPKPVDVVFVVEGDHVKMVPVKIGISDDNYWEITDGLKEGEEVVSGGFRAISRDLEDGAKIRKGSPGKEAKSGT